MPEIVTIKDYDGYFTNLVKEWCKRKTEFKHTTIKVNAAPFLPDALQYRSSKGTLELTFYSALRAGFGGFDEGEIEQIIELL